MNEFFATNIATSYSPLVVVHRSEGRNWRLDVQQSPVPEITLTGDTPTRDEIVNALLRSSIPANMIPVIEVMAAVAQRK